MMPLFVALPGHRQRGLHLRLARIIIQLPSGACCRVIPDDSDRHDFRLSVLGEALVQFEIHRVLPGGMLKAARKPRVDGGGRSDWTTHAPEGNRRGVGIDLIQEAAVVVRPDVPTHVVQSGLRVALPDLTQQQSILVIHRRAILGIGVTNF